MTFGGRGCIITKIKNICNNGSYGLDTYIGAGNIVTEITNINSNISYGVSLANTNFLITKITNIRNNGSHGLNSGTQGYSSIIKEISNCSYNTGYGIYTDANLKVHNVTTSFNTSGGAFVSYTSKFIDCSFAEANEIVVNTGVYSNAIAYSHRHDKTPNTHRIICTGGTIIYGVSGSPATGYSYTFSPTSTYRTSVYPLAMPIGRFAVNANKLVTISAYFQLSYATDIGAALVCRGGQIPGVSSDVKTTATADTNRNLTTITFTPTEIGVVQIEAQVYWLANTADENCIVNNVTFSQAD